MSGFELRQQQAREFASIIRWLERYPTAPLHDAVRAVVGMSPSLTFEYLQIAFNDWSAFRLETAAEIESMIEIALKARAA